MEIILFFWTLLYINLFTIGGGFAMIPLLQSEIVSNHHWLTQSEFIESIAVGQMTPGPLTIMNAFIGFKVFGIWGAVGSVFATYIPSLVVVTIVAHYYNKVKNSEIIASVMRGIKPAVIGLIAATAIILGMESIQNNITVVISVSSLVLLVFTKIDPTFVIIASGIAGAFLL